MNYRIEIYLSKYYVNQDDESQPLEENNALSRWTASFRKCFARIRCCCISRKVNKIPPETSRTNFLTAPFVRSRIDKYKNHFY